MGFGRSWTTTTVLAVGASLLAAPGGAARAPAPAPVAHVACEQSASSGCSEAGTDTLPAGSYGSEETDVVPSATTSATEQVEPAPGSNLAAFDGIWATVVQDMPKLAKITSAPVRRFITCHLFAQTGAALQQYTNQTFDRADSTYDSSYLMAMGACLSLVKSMQDAAAGTPASGAADIASTRCNQATLALPVEVSKVGSKFRLHVNAGPRPVRRKVGLRVTCKRAGAGWRIGLSPQKKAARLGPLIGPHLQIGFANSAKRTAAVHTTFTFH